MSNNNISVVVVGSGVAGSMFHLPAYRRLSGVQVCAICDVDLERASQVAQDHQVPHTYASLAEALERNNVQVVSICTPPQTHLELATVAMERGCHVLLEKPLTWTLDEADELRKVQQRTGCKLSVVHQQKFTSGVVGVHQLIQSGAIGEIRQLDMVFMRNGYQDRMIIDPNFWCHSIPGGRWAECIPHQFYVAYSLVGKMRLVNVIAKNVSNNWPYLPADEVQVLLESQAGYVTIRLSVNLEERIRAFSILHGTKQAFYFDYNELRKVPPDVASPQEIIRGLIGRSPRLFQKVLQRIGTRHRDRVGDTERHQTVIKRFVRHVIADEPSPTSWEEAYHVMQLTDEFGRVLEKVVGGVEAKVAKQKREPKW